MVAINVFAADTDELAQRLATSQHQSFLALIRGTPGRIKPPVDDMDAIWSPQEKAMVNARVGGSIIGGPDAVRAGLEAFAEETQADELMVNGIFYDHTERLRSYEIVADIWKEGTRTAVNSAG
jgi:alkanesulfonate monooxygenase SsuD/methylene tetrahydromethanopterin reductase-like flavin-dependent oxidoreductase (luciferase family)